MRAVERWTELWESAEFEEDGSVGFGPSLDELKEVGDTLAQDSRALRLVLGLYNWETGRWGTGDELKVATFTKHLLEVKERLDAAQDKIEELKTQIEELEDE